MNVQQESIPPMPRIALIDGDSISLKVISEILEREYPEGRILTFQSPKQALSFLGRRTVNLIVLDLWMPELNGFEVLTTLKANPATASVPVVVLTASDQSEDLDRSFTLGADDFIHKPIFPNAFAARIATLLKNQGLQQALREKNTQLNQLNHLKNELLSICSHDLRAPLSAIDLLCQFLLDQTKAHKISADKPNPIELGKRILHQSRTARRLVDNLLDLNRIEDGELSATPSFFDPIELIEQCLESEHAFIENRNLHYTLSKPEHDLVCFGDRQLIWQLVRNLLSNAVKFAAQAIHLSCSEQELGEQGGQLQITIYNDGVGINPAMRQQVFEKHVKVDQSTEGRGMGLYISKKIVTLHGGKIWVDSPQKDGTTFIVNLPNLFYPNQLPDLGDYSRAMVWIASASRRTAQLLESVLIEGGMVDVRIIDNLNRFQTHPQPQANLAESQTGACPLIVDIETIAPTPALLEGTAAETLPLITYGSAPAEQRNPAPPLPGRAHVESPLNPLQLLTQIKNQLQHTLKSVQYQ